MFSPYIIFFQVMEEKHAEKAELVAAIAAIRFTFQTRRLYEARERIFWKRCFFRDCREDSMARIRCHIGQVYLNRHTHGLPQLFSFMITTQF